MRTSQHDLMWRQLLPTVRKHDQSLQVQLCTAFVTAMLEGRLPGGTRLPSSRDLAMLTGVSRNTAVLVYERLVAEGYVDARPRDGFFVCGAITPTQNAQPNGDQHCQPPDWTARMLPCDPQIVWAERPPSWRDVRYPFIYGQFDPKQFPLTQWRQCSRQALEVRAVDRWWQEGESVGSSQLIDQLIRRVLPRRGIAATHDQVLLTLGRQQSFYLLARLFTRPGTVVGVEEPGFRDPRNAFAHEGAQVMSLPIDEQGLLISPALASCNYLYCTPAYQCPTGVTMSQARRQALLEHIQLHDQVVFEDDDDPETEYDGRALPALKATDSAQRVIYLSSLSKLLSPGLGIGYIVAPAPVIEQLRQLQRLMIRQTPGNNQITAALFIQQGHYDRLLQQARENLQQRAATLANALRDALPDAEFVMPSGGATLWLKLSGQHDLLSLYYAGAAKGVLFDPGNAFCHEPNTMLKPSVRLGFGSIAHALIAPGIAELGRVVNAKRRGTVRG